MFPDYPLAQRQTIADRWFSTMYFRATNSTRTTFGSRFSSDAERLFEKWKVSTGRLSFQDMLNDLSSFLALSSQDNSQKYLEYWNAALNKGTSSGQTKPIGFARA